MCPEVKTVIFRVMQEALNNIAKHSNANLVSLSLRKKEGRIELTVQDNGMGFELQEILPQERSRRGLGLTSMRERAELSGGPFGMESTIGQGTTIRVSWPI
jgi:signal transduction histidine kinase